MTTLSYAHPSYREYARGDCWAASSLKPLLAEGAGAKHTPSASSRCGSLLLSLSTDVRSFDDVIAFKDHQYKGMMKIADYFSWLQCRAEYKHIRPTTTLKRGTTHLWWKYAIKAVLGRWKHAVHSKTLHGNVPEDVRGMCTAAVL